MLYRIQEELRRVEEALVSGKLSDEQYIGMFAVQQALTWVLDERIAALPFDTAMNVTVRNLRDVVPTDTLAN